MFDRGFAEKRAKVMRGVREFFDSRGFLEVDVPIMTLTVDPEPNLTPFESELFGPDEFVGAGGSGGRRKVFLVPSPEFQMKKLLGDGFGDIYTITKVFRNGEIGGGRHNPEFTMLEWYKANANYFDVMEETEDLILAVAESVVGVSDAGVEEIQYQGQKIDLRKPWDRVSIRELFIKNCGIDLNENKTFEEFSEIAKEKDYDINGCATWDDILYKIFLNHIEPGLGFGRPVFVYDYPASQGALAKKKDSDPFWVERFELYIAGKELCNAFSELLDSKEQRKRFEDSLNERKRLQKNTFDIDEEFLTSLESIRFPYGGNALGVDRLMMVLLNKPKIEDVLLFPFTKMINQ